MNRFLILQGLPGTGPPAKAFPEAWGRLGREGLVVRIEPVSGPPWIANFGPGLSNFSGLFPHPNGQQLLVVSRGQGYLIDPDSQLLIAEVGGAIVGATEVQEPHLLILDHQGISFECFGADARHWRTRRLSWDGFRDVRLGPGAITGEGWTPWQTWHPFRVDLLTGRSEGGAYSGPDALHGEQLSVPGNSAA